MNQRDGFIESGKEHMVCT